MGRIDSRDRHRFAKHCLTTKGGSCSFSRSKHFSRCPTRRRFDFRALHWCQRTALLESDTRVWFGRYGERSSLFPQFRTARTNHLTSYLASARAKQVVHDSLFSLSHAAKRISFTIVDSCGCAQHDTFTEPGHVSLQLHTVFIDNGTAVCLSECFSPCFFFLVVWRT